MPNTRDAAPKVISGMADSLGFVLTVDRGEGLERLEFYRYRFKRRLLRHGDPVMDFLEGLAERHPLVDRLLDLVEPTRFVLFGFMGLALLVLNAFFPPPAERIPLQAWAALLPLALLFAAFLHLSGAASWHGLEHKAANFLEERFRSPGPTDEESVYRGLKEASVLHLWCGSLDSFLFLGSLVFFGSLLPLNAALVLAPLPIVFRHPESLRKALLPLQRLTVREPGERRLRFVAKALSEYLQGLEGPEPMRTEKAW